MVCDEKARGRNLMQRDGDNKMSVERIERKLDSSNRVKIPKRWLAMAGRCKCVCLMPDPKEGCLRLISQGDIEKRMAKLREKALTDPAVYRAVQIIGKEAELRELDSEGRVAISDRLLHYAQIKRRLIMVGGECYTQLWGPRRLCRRVAMGIRMGNCV